MTIDWMSLLLGITIGIVIANVLALIASYLKLNRAKKKLDASTAKLKDFEVKLEEKRKEILGELNK